MGTLVVSNVCLKVVMNFYDFATVEQNSFFKTVTKKNVVPCVWFIVLLHCVCIQWHHSIQETLYYLYVQI